MASEIKENKMKIHNVKVCRDARDWSTFAIIEYDDPIREKKGFEMFPMLVSDFFECKNKKVIGYFYDSFEDLMQQEWINNGYRYTNYSIKEADSVWNERFNSLQNGTMSKKDFTSIFGIDDSALDEIVQINPRIHGDGDIYNRWELEKILYSSKLLTKRQAALCLGLKISCFDDVIEFLRQDFSMLKYSLVPNFSFIPSNFEDAIKSACFPSQTFDTEESFKHQFHNLLQSRGVQFESEYCFITRALKFPRDNFFFASYIDLFLHRCVNRIFSIPIKNDKPGYLPSDRISFYSYLMYEKKFKEVNMYIPNQDALDKFKELIESV